MNSLFLAKFMTSRNGERLMKLGDFTFIREWNIEAKTFWTCYTHRNNKCLAKIFTKNNKVVFAKNHHNHPPTEFFV